VLVAGLMVLAAFMAMVFVPVAGASSPLLAPTLKVPSQYSSIQKAIQAAHSGATILVAPGTYVEQLTIDKSVTIIGAGVGKTVIQSPANLNPDGFGNPWTIEIGNGATVTLSGFTLRVTLQCILLSGLPPIGVAHTHIGVYAGGGIGVGGSAVLNLESAVVTTTGATEGSACGSSPAGEMSYGTGVDFGLDYVTGFPPASELVGTGTVSGVNISGFGFGGPGVSIGGQANSPAGSNAVVSNDQITTSADDAGYDDTPSNTAPAISVGFGGNPGSATIVGNVLSGLLSISTDVIDVVSGSSAYIAHNSILVGPEEDAIVISSSSTTITLNSIAGSTTDFSGGIILFGSSATVSFNALSNFECEFNPATVLTLFGLTCGPSDATQAQVLAIGDFFDAGLGTVIENNLVSDADVGISLDEGCPGCVVKGNVVINSPDYGLAGYDGSYSFLQDLVVGGLYGVASIAVVANTTVTLSHVVFVGQSVAPPPYYYENDCFLFFGYTCSTPTIVGT
jgi:hypothetical protein